MALIPCLSAKSFAIKSLLIVGTTAAKRIPMALSPWYKRWSMFLRAEERSFFAMLLPNSKTTPALVKATWLRTCSTVTVLWSLERNRSIFSMAE